MADIYAHVEEKCKESKGAMSRWENHRAKIKKFGSWDNYLKSEGKAYNAFDPRWLDDQHRSREGIINMKVEESIYDKQSKTLRKGEWFEPTGFDHMVSPCGKFVTTADVLTLYAPLGHRVPPKPIG